MGSRPQSTRRHAWHVQPISTSTGKPACMSSGIRETIMCGHLFNAHAERSALGLGVGEGEECCITLEPIADAQLSFSEKIRVSSMHPFMTGVELLCGHRFSAVNLLWHWCRSPMVCPMCRASYVLHGQNGSNGSMAEAIPMSSALDNFPFQYWRQLRGIMDELTRERNIEQERENQAAIVSAVMSDVLETVFAPLPDFFLMFSFERPGLPPDHHSIRLRSRGPINNMTEENRFSFIVPRAATRYISRLFRVAGMENQRGGEPVSINAMILVGVGRSADGVSVMLPITRFSNQVLPLIPEEDCVMTPSENTDVTDDESMPHQGVQDVHLPGEIGRSGGMHDNNTSVIEGIVHNAGEIHVTDNAMSMDSMQIDGMNSTVGGGDGSVSNPVGLSHSNDVISDVNGRSIVRMVSHDTLGQVVLHFFRGGLQFENTLVSVEVSVEAFPTLSLVAHHVVNDHRANML